MTSSRPRLEALAALFALLVGGCAIGDGEGELRGVFQSARCGFDEPRELDLRPSFFGADPVEDQLNLRIQRGSEIEFYADGLIITVNDANGVARERLGQPLDVGSDPEDPVQMVLYLNVTCPAGPPNDFFERPAAYQAVSGTATFDAIYAPEVAISELLIDARLDDLRFEERDDPTEFAELDGRFAFFFQRGAPAQRFP